MKGIIDRFEDDIVVVEIDGKIHDFSKAIFPEGIEVGDVVEIEGENISVLKDDTEKRRKEIEDLMDDVWED